MTKKIATITQLRKFAKEVGIKTVSGHTRTSLTKEIISKAELTNQYTIAFMDWYKQLDDALFDKKGKMLKPLRPKLKIFNIETYRNCEIYEENYRRKYICTFPKGDLFEFSIDLNRSTFEAEFECVYKTKDGKAVLLYRAKPNEHLHKFWTQLGNEFYKRNTDYKEGLRDKILDEFNFNWEG